MERSDCTSSNVSETGEADKLWNIQSLLLR